MKRCSTCDRTFEDTLTYCLIDGSILSAPFAPQATLVIPEPKRTEPSQVKAPPVHPARKSKRFPLIIGVVAAVLVLAIAAVIYFGKREEYRIVDVRLFREGKSTTRFLPNDAITVTVKVMPVAKEGSLWVTKSLLFRGENQLMEIPDTDPAPPPLSMSSTSFPLSGASQPGSYLLEVALSDGVNKIDSHAVWFEVIQDSK